MDRALRDAEVARYVRRQPYFRPGTIDAEYLSLHSVNVPNVSGETEAHARSQVRNNQGICFASIEIVISTKLHEEKLILTGSYRWDVRAFRLSLGSILSFSDLAGKR